VSHAVVVRAAPRISKRSERTVELVVSVLDSQTASAVQKPAC
jgi:hypothetical protein